MATLNSNTRTTASDVKEIFETDLAETELNHHINAAAELVDEIDSAGSLSSQRLTLIEEYLAAHIASTQDPRVSDVSVGDSSFTYKGSQEMTDYWETAAQLDKTGTLDESDDAPAAVFTSTDYDA